MFKFVKKVFKPKVNPLNKIVVLRQNILHNISFFEMSNPWGHIFPVIKSNAYGYWLKEILQILNKTDIHTVCVDSFIEYQYVINHSKKNVLVLWETNYENYKNFDFKRSSFCVFNLKTIKYLAWLKKKIKIHLFLNTWMNREWLDKEDLNKVLKIISSSKLILDWVCSHFSSADEVDNIELNNQIWKFKELYKKIEKAGFSPIYKHISASSWALKLDDDFFNTIRLWIAIYGYNPLAKEDKSFKKWKKLKPALEVFSTVVSVHKIEAKEWVWYNHTFKAKKATKIATIPFWYYEWLDRKFSNNLTLKCKGKYYSVVWRISMNYTNFDIWRANIKVWDKVQIISSNQKDKNSVKSLANAIKTIDYEVITRLNSTICREVV